MNILFFLIPLSVILFAFVIWGFFWAVKSEQFENLEAHGLSIFKDEPQIEKNSENTKDTEKNSIVRDTE